MDDENERRKGKRVKISTAQPSASCRCVIGLVNDSIVIIKPVANIMCFISCHRLFLDREEEEEEDEVDDDVDDDEEKQHKRQREQNNHGKRLASGRYVIGLVNGSNVIVMPVATLMCYSQACILFFPSE